MPPTTFSDVEATLNAAAEKAQQVQQALQQVVEMAEECATVLTDVMAGTTEQADAEMVTGQFGAVRAGAMDLLTVLASCLQGIEKVRKQFATGPPAASAPTPGGTSGGGGGDDRQSDTWARRARSALPAFKTSGVYRDDDGNEDLVQSGREPDGEHTRINDHLTTVGVLWPGQNAEVTKHVETKVAWRMRQSGISRAEVVVNKEVCEGMLGCREVLPLVLGAGQTLTVHDPVGSHTFRGRDAR